MPIGRLNPSLFLTSEENALIAYLADKQKKYKIVERKYIDRLMDYGFSNQLEVTDSDIDQNLLKSALIVVDHKDTEYNYWEGDKISLITHQTSRITSLSFPPQPQSEVIDGILSLGQRSDQVPDRYMPTKFIKCYDLPLPDENSFSIKDFFQLLKLRKTTRNFDDVPIDLPLFAALLYFGFNISQDEEASESESGFDINILKRTSPSATGLQSLDAFIVVNNIPPLERGYYFYDSINHKLYLLESVKDPIDLSYALADQFWAHNLSAGIFLTADMRRVWVKDINIRGYLSLYLEAGHLSQTTLLLATALNLQTWMTGSFRDDIIIEMLKIHEPSVFPCFFIGLGHGSGSAIPEDLNQTV